MKKQHLWYSVVLLLTAVFGPACFSDVSAAPIFAVPGSTATTKASFAPRRQPTAYGELPLAFEINQGQTAKAVKFISRGSGGSLFLTPTEAVLSLVMPQKRQKAQSANPSHATQVTVATKPVQPAVLRMKLLGANPQPRMMGLEEQPGKSNYFLGDNRKGWRKNIAHYGKVRYENVYRGIDLIYHSEQRQLEYDFIVAPRVNTDVI